MPVSVSLIFESAQLYPWSPYLYHYLYPYLCFIEFQHISLGRFPIIWAITHNHKVVALSLVKLIKLSFLIEDLLPFWIKIKPYPLFLQKQGIFCVCSQLSWIVYVTLTLCEIFLVALSFFGVIGTFLFAFSELKSLFVSMQSDFDSSFEWKWQFFISIPVCCL